MGWISGAVTAVSETVGKIHDNRTKVNLRKGELIDATKSRNHTWELAALAGDGWEEPFIRLAIYFEVLYLVIIAIYDPIMASGVYAAINPVYNEIGEQTSGLPAWVIGLHMTIAGWGFGSQPIKAIGAGLVGSALAFPKRS